MQDQFMFTYFATPTKLGFWKSPPEPSRITLKDCQIFISDDVSKIVRQERAKLRKDYLKEIKDREAVEFAFIPWSVPAQILYKETGSDKLKSFKLPE